MTVDWAVPESWIAWAAGKLKEPAPRWVQEYANSVPFDPRDYEHHWPDVMPFSPPCNDMHRHRRLDYIKPLTITVDDLMFSDSQKVELRRLHNDFISRYPEMKRYIDAVSTTEITRDPLVHRLSGLVAEPGPTGPDQAEEGPADQDGE